MQASIYPITPFDASKGTTIMFSWTGSQAFKNQCIIYEHDDTSEPVYDATITSFRLEHLINLSAAKLENGKYYDVYIVVYDKDGVASDLQTIPTTFQCLTTPTFEFVNCANEQIIPSSSYNFELNYEQIEGELLDSWTIFIYDGSYNLLESSGLQYGDNLSYLFTGFSNNRAYIVTAQGRTVSGCALTTPEYRIFASYEIDEEFSPIVLENLNDIGAILIKSNIISPDGTLLDDPVYIKHEYLDLLNNTLTYDKGYELSGDFAIVVKAYNLVPNKPQIMQYSVDGEDLQMEVVYRLVSKGQYPDQLNSGYNGYFELRVTSNTITSIYNSNIINDTSYTLQPVILDGTYTLDGSKRLFGEEYRWNDTQDKVCFCIVRKDQKFEIFADNSSEVV